MRTSLKLVCGWGAAILAGALAPAGPAAAAPADPESTLVDGMGAGDVFLNGHFMPTRFAADPAGHLVVDGTLTGTLTGPVGMTQRNVDQALSLPVDRGATTGSCWMIDLMVGPAERGISGDAVHVDRADLHIEVEQGPGSRLRTPMCQFAVELPDDSVDNARLADTLNQILALRSSAPLGA